ncbi:MAG TPA: hemerythrin domain-containing protein [Nitrospira sp.]|nr:hemerythrin domain-containing protein [Nitrospira sp.]
MAKRTSKKSQSKSSQPADAVQMLKADHKQVRKFFEQFYDAPDNDKGSIAGKLFLELGIHSKLEEELFYPAVQSQLESFVRGNGLDVADDEEGETVEDAELTFDPIDGAELEAIDDDDDASEVISASYESHRTVHDLIQQLRFLDPKSDDFRELFTELEEAVIEHVAEEEDVILPLAAAQLDVQTLGIKMQRRRDDLRSQSSLAA